MSGDRAGINEEKLTSGNIPAPFHCTFIARYSSYGPDYSSGGQFCWSSPHLNKALRLAHEQGLLKGDVLINLKGEQARWLKYCQEDPQYKERIDERFQEERFLLP